MQVKHFVNLTNGIEIVPELANFSFLRIRSTTIEKKNWFKLLYDVDHNLLMWLALGYTCYVYDYGTRRPVSKTINFGLPLIKYCLERFWLGKTKEQIGDVPAGKAMTDRARQIDKIYESVFTYQKHMDSMSDIEKLAMITEKYAYYRKFLATDTINLIGVSEATAHDGNWEFYSQILKELKHG